MYILNNFIIKPNDIKEKEIYIDAPKVLTIYNHLENYNVVVKTTKESIDKIYNAMNCFNLTNKDNFNVMRSLHIEKGRYLIEHPYKDSCAIKEKKEIIKTIIDITVMNYIIFEILIPIIKEQNISLNIKKIE